MNDESSFADLETSFRAWQQQSVCGPRLYEPLITALETHVPGNHTLLQYGYDTRNELGWLPHTWTVAEADESLQEPSLSRLGNSIDETSIALILYRAIDRAPLRKLYDLVLKAQRALIDGGAIVFEINPNTGSRRLSSGVGQFQETFSFLSFCLQRLDFQICDAVPIAKRAFPKSSAGDELNAGGQERSLLVLAWKRGDSSSSHYAAIGDAVRAIRIAAFSAFLGAQQELPDTGLVGWHSAPDWPDAGNARRRWLTDAGLAEEAVAALSKTALGADDLARRLLKIERRVLSIRTQISLLAPITYPWALLASRIFRAFSTYKAGRRTRRHALKLDKSPDGAKSGQASIRIDSPRALGEMSIGTRPNILILKLDHIGDFFLSLPAVEIIKSAWPEGHLTVICSPTNAGLARSCGLFDEVKEYKYSSDMSEEIKKRDMSLYASILGVVKGAFDLAIDLRHDPDTRPHLGFIQAKIKAGFQSHGKHYTPLDISIPLMSGDKGLHAGVHNIQRLMILASHVVNVLSPPPFKPIADSLISATGSNVTVPAGNYIVLAPGGGTKAKKWMPDSFADLARRLLEQPNLTVVLLGGSAEQEYSDAIIQAVGHERVLDLIDKLSLTDMPYVISKAAAFAGTDTGATHLAALLGVPTVAIFSGVADVDIWGPLGDHVSIVRHPIACAPCQISRLDQCVADHACMKAIETGIVFNEVCRVGQLA